MKRRRHTPEQIVRKLREAERLLGEGQTIAEAAKQVEISEQTYHRWRNQYGGMKADDARRLRELERETARLKRIVAGKERRLDDALVRREMRPLLRSGLVLRARPRPSDAGTPQRGRFWRARLDLCGSALVKTRSRAEPASACQHIGAAMVEPGEQGLTIGQSACGCDPAASEDPTPHSARDEA